MLSLMPDKKTLLKEAFLESKKLIENGWCQNHFVTQNFLSDSLKEEYCLAGAFQTVAGSIFFSDLIDSFVKANQLTVIKTDRGFGCTVTRWNDAPERKKEEVLIALDKAIQHVGGL